MDPRYEYDCDQVYDFNNIDKTVVDEWFEIDRETNRRTSFKLSKPERILIKAEVSAKDPSVELTEKLSAISLKENVPGSENKSNEDIEKQDRTETDNVEQKKIDYKEMLKQRGAMARARPKERSAPLKPISIDHLASNKRKYDGSPYRSMAEKVRTYQFKTPDRFHSKQSKVPKLVSPLQTRCTVPQTPLHLHRQKRRKSRVLSYDEREEQLADEMKKKPFKATLLDKKIFEPVNTNYLRRNSRSRAENTPNSSTVLMDKMASGDKIASGARRRSRSMDSLNSVKSQGVPFVPKLVKKVTSIQPFSFDQYDKKRLEEKEKKIMETIEAEKKLAVFKAKGAPSFDEVVLPEVAAPKPTVFNPFNLLSEYRHKLSLQNFKAKVKEVEAEEEARRNFRARECTVTQVKPFEPELGLLPPTQFQPFAHYLEARTEDREKFKDYKKEREISKEAARLQAEKEMEEELERIAKEARKNTLHKAQPIPKFQPFEIKQSQKPLTEPITPAVYKRAGLRKSQSVECVYESP